jgi:hypothetical protein
MQNVSEHAKHTLIHKKATHTTVQVDNPAREIKCISGAYETKTQPRKKQEAHLRVEFDGPCKGGRAAEQQEPGGLLHQARQKQRPLRLALLDVVGLVQNHLHANTKKERNAKHEFSERRS